MAARYLTKSRFKIGQECPAKLFYTGKKNEYADSSADDAFLKSLAEGGFQVGELAKLYYPGGYNIDSLDIETALHETDMLLKKDDVTIFEAAIRYKNFLIRIDVLEKHGNTVNLIEVKAKSTKTTDTDDFFNSTKTALKSEMKPYLYDAVFQKYVLEHAFPTFNVSAYLMLADKTQRASIDGLNQRFFLMKDSKGRSHSIVKDMSDTGNKILSLVNVDAVADFIFETREEIEGQNLSFEQYIHYLADAYAADRKIDFPIGAFCKSCEFKASLDDEVHGRKSGFKECWKKQTMLKDADFNIPMIFEIWNFRKNQECIDKGIFHIKDIDEAMFDVKKKDNETGLQPTERQLLQIKKVKNGDTTPYIDVDGLRNEMASWKYPLHMIDFETSMVAIPFNRGRHPYEAIAFQFSHHVIYEDGSYEHKGQFLHAEQGAFPNYDFVRALKKELENDNGSIFRYATHENSILCAIHSQLIHDTDDMPDKDELLCFIESITHSNDNAAKHWTSSRDMIDLRVLVLKYYYHPYMKGSNSIKYVLPAILESDFIQNKYSKPVYGGEIKSLNFTNYIWIVKDANGKVKSPYKLLPPLFDDVDDEILDSFITDEKLADGGAAMTAYTRMQFTEMTEMERKYIKEGLLRYCELDTLAMVMVFEYFKSAT